MRLIYRSLLAISLIIVLLPFSSMQSALSAEAARSGIKILQSAPDALLLGLDSQIPQISEKIVNGSVFHEVKLAGLENSQTPGGLMLPTVSVMIGVPPQGDVHLSIVSEKSEIIPGNFRIVVAPVRQVEFTSPADLEAGAAFGVVSQKDIYRPESKTAVKTMLAQLSDEAWIRGQRVMRLTINPVQYQAQTGQLTFYKNLSVQITFDQPVVEKNSAAEVAPFESVLKDTLINYEQSRGWRKPQDSKAVWNPGNTNGCPQSLCYKITVDHNGIYKVTYESLAALGLVGASTDPAYLNLSSQGLDVAYSFVGDDDTLFEAGEYLLFFGEKLNGERLAALYAAEDDNWLVFSNGWAPQFNKIMVEKYTDDNVYWLWLGTSTGLRTTSIAGTPATAPSTTYYRAIYRYDLMTYLWVNNFWSEDMWFGDYIPNTTVKNFTFTTSQLATGTHSVNVRGDIQAYTEDEAADPDHHTRITLNTLGVIDDAQWEGLTRRHFDASVDQATYLVSGTNRVNMSQILDLYVGQPDNTYYVDWFEVEYSRQLAAVTDALDFLTVDAGLRKYAVRSFTSPGVLVWDVTNPLEPVVITGATFASNTATFERDAAVGARIYVVGSNTLQTPKALSAYAPPDIISAANGADYLIITHSAFITDAQRLATYRATQGHRVKIVDIQDIYNQFNFGITHPIATKNFLATAYSNWAAPAPTYVLLVGDGNWRMKKAGAPTQYLLPNREWVDPYTGETDSSNALAAISGTDIIPDFLISRIPVNSSAELNAVIDKIFANEAITSLQSWQKHLLFVADNIPDVAGDFVALSEDTITRNVFVPFVADRVYLNTFSCDTAGTPECLAVKTAIADALNTTGAGFVVYNGHGAKDSWTSELVWTNTEAKALTNNGKLPFIISMTCLDGFWDYVASSPAGLQESQTEAWLRSPNTGGVAALASPGFGLTSGHDSMQNAFLDKAFQSDTYIAGEAVLASKMAVYASGSDYDLIQTYSLFGDPAMKSIAGTKPTALDVAQVTARAYPSVELPVALLTGLFIMGSSAYLVRRKKK